MWRLLLPLLSLAGCLAFQTGDCGGELYLPFDPGTFQSMGGRWAGGKSRFAHAEVGAKTLVLERRGDNTALVRITYQREGKTIVETWESSGGTIPWATPTTRDAADD
jgi:hypothetical protein